MSRLGAVRQILATTDVSDRLRRSRLRAGVSWWRHRGIGPEDVMLASFPRSGNTWVKFMLAELMVGSEVNSESNSEIVPMLGNQQGAPRLLDHRGRLIKTHEPYAANYSRAIYLVRDVRDVAHSFFRFRSIDGFADKNFSSYLSLFAAGKISGFGSWQSHVDSWLDAEQEGRVSLSMIRYEDLVDRPVEILGQMAEFLGIKSDAQTLECTVANNTTDRMRQRSAGDSGKKMSATIGKGRYGGWRDAYSATQIDLLAPARPTMERLGYAW